MHQEIENQNYKLIISRHELDKYLYVYTYMTSKHVEKKIE